MMIRLLLIAVALLQTAQGILTEQPIQLLPNQSAPTRISGYFKLEKTYDVHIFYFLFESRSGSPDAPLVLWMTGDTRTHCPAFVWTDMQ